MPRTSKPSLNFRPSKPTLAVNTPRAGEGVGLGATAGNYQQHIAPGEVPKAGNCEAEGKAFVDAAAESYAK